MTTLFRTHFLIVLYAALFALFMAGCGATEDPTEQNNPRNDVGQHDVDKEEEQTPVNPYEKLGLPYTLHKLPPATTAPWPGSIGHGALVKIAHVIDGDTVVSELKNQKNLRLVGMDAPECAKRNFGNGMECDPDNTEYTTQAKEEYPNEPYGAQAGQALKDLIAINPEVRIACKMVSGECERDMFKRFLVWIVVDTPDGPVDASHYIIEKGLGWPYTKYPTENLAMYCQAEDEAIAEKRGMWKNGFQAAYDALTPETKNWYQDRDRICGLMQP